MSRACGHGSFPLTRLRCSVRLLRSASMCLALSQVSLHREVCPRLSDSNLPTEWTHTHTHFAETGQSRSEFVQRNRRAHLATTSSLWRSSADTLSGSSFLMSTKSSSTDCGCRKQTSGVPRAVNTSKNEYLGESHF